MPMERRFSMRFGLAGLVAVLCLTSCDVDSSAAPTTRASAGSAVVTTVPTTMPSSVRLLSAWYMCGPSEQAWVGATVSSSVPVTVLAQVVLDGTALGRSERIAVTPAEPSTISFEPGTKGGDYGRSATMQVFIAGDEGSGTPVAQRDFVLSIPPDVACG